MRVCQPVINMVDHDGVMSGGRGDWIGTIILLQIIFPAGCRGMYEVLKCESGYGRASLIVLYLYLLSHYQTTLS